MSAEGVVKGRDLYDGKKKKKSIVKEQQKNIFLSTLLVNMTTFLLK